MHGRPRLSQSQREQLRSSPAATQRLDKFAKVCNEVLRRIERHQDDAATMALSAALLEQNPECYTVWTFRRRVLSEQMLDHRGVLRSESSEQELQLTEKALRKNPKSYQAWHHRRWAVMAGATSLEHELKLIGQLLSQDDRNFHGWSYRRWVAAQAAMSPEYEEQYARDCIHANFSNYSAWHARSQLLPQLPENQQPLSLHDLMAKPAGAQAAANPKPQLRLSVLEQELQLVRQAMYTEPEDQSAWMYHRWLLSMLLPQLRSTRPKDVEEARQLLESEVDACQDLIGLEADRSKCKWPLLTLARLHRLQLDLPGADRPRLEQEVVTLFEQLIDVDPKRAGYYRDELAGKACIVLSRQC